MTSIGLVIELTTGSGGIGTEVMQSMRNFDTARMFAFTGVLIAIALGLAAVLTAASDRFDIGGKFNLMYGYEGITGIGAVPGFKLQGVARLQLLERGKLNLGLRFEPGVFSYFFAGGGAEVGVALPFEFNLGIAISPKLMANVGLDIPMFAVFGPYGGLAIPLLVGGGVEYAFDNQLGLTFNTRVGPSVPLAGNRVFAPNFNNAYCQEPNGRWYRCGGYYTNNIVAVELMLGVSYRL